ncbi:MAG: TM0106 family RecB-like putative nuclease [Actinomycetota bacterium]
MRLIASDFWGYYRPSECSLRVWLRQQRIEEAAPGPFAELLMRLGREHEERHLAQFPNHLDLGRLPIAERAERTREAVAAGDAVVYQGAFRKEELAGTPVEIVGVPDFLLPTRSGYAIRDSKLSRRLEGHIEIELQLQLYGWLYEQTFGEPAAALQVHAGSGEILDLPYEGGEPALEMLERILRIRLASDPPQTSVGWSKCSACPYFQRCWPPAVERGVVGLVPGADRGLVEELQAQGVETIEQLLESFDEASLAEFERPWGKKRMKVGGKAARVLIGAQAIQDGAPIVLQRPAIPAHPNYVMFDLEGMPPQLDQLEKIYLWGMQVFGADPGPFRAATAGFAPHGDCQGWEAFLRKAETIFSEHGDIPFVHWANYERTKINLYVTRFGDRNGIAARVVRNLFDLYPITYESIAVPASSYGLKQIEKLVGFERTLPDAAGDWSMARYIEATETNDAGSRAQIMDEVLTYNREDLEATWAVLCWLRELQPPS